MIELGVSQNSLSGDLNFYVIIYIFLNSSLKLVTVSALFNIQLLSKTSERLFYIYLYFFSAPRDNTVYYRTMKKSLFKTIFSVISVEQAIPLTLLK